MQFKNCLKTVKSDHNLETVPYQLHLNHLPNMMTFLRWATELKYCAACGCMLATSPLLPNMSNCENMNKISYKIEWAVSIILRTDIQVQQNTKVECAWKGVTVWWGKN